MEVTHRGSMRRKYRISGLTNQATNELEYVFLVNPCSNFLVTLRFGVAQLVHHGVWHLLLQRNESYGANCALYCADFLLTRMEL